MYVNRAGKKDSRNTSRLEDGNVSINSGLNVDYNQKKKETPGRNIKTEEQDKSLNESRDGSFTNPSDKGRKNYMSPTSTQEKAGSRSPTGTKSIIQCARNDLNAKKPIQALPVQLPGRKEAEESSNKPKTINLAGEKEYNQRSLRPKKSPRESIDMERSNYNSENLNMDLNPQTYTQKQNLKLDSQMRKDPRETDREIQFGADKINSNSREKNLDKKMSPPRNNAEKETESGRSPLNRAQKMKSLKEISKFALNTNCPFEDKGTNVDNLYQNYGKDIESLMQMKDVVRNTMPTPTSYNYNRQLTKGFTPVKAEGVLLTKAATIHEPINDHIFADRKSVLQKMNRLSHILLSKSMPPEEKDRPASNFNSRNSLKNINQSPPSKKFMRLTMALISSKGPNCENRTLTRGMRGEKGGVVDLARLKQGSTSTFSPKENKKYEVKQIRRVGEKPNPQQVPKKFTSKDREKAVKTVQAWWRDMLGNYKAISNKIVKIQKMWRGHWFRTNLYEIVYSTILIESFVTKIKNTLVMNIRKQYFGKLLPFAAKYKARRNLTFILKVQRIVKRFLQILRNKRKTHEKKRDALASDLITKVKRAMRIRIFHTLFFSTQNKEVNKLKQALFKKIVKGYFKNASHTVPLQTAFKLWRDITAKKNNLKPFIEGTKHLEKHVRNRVFAKVMPINISTGAKTRGLKCIRKKSDKFKIIPLRHYFNKLKKVVAHQKQKDSEAMLVVNIQRKCFKKISCSILKKRLMLWKEKNVALRNRERYTNLDLEKKRIFAVAKIMSGTERLAKRAAFKITYPKITQWLSNIILQKALKKLLFMTPKLERITKKNYWNKLRGQNEKLRRKELRNAFFNSLFKKTNSNLSQNLLRKSIQKWNRKLPRSINIQFYNGTETLISALRRRNLQKPVDAFKAKIDLRNAKQGVLKAFNVKDKFSKRHCRDSLIKWKRISEKIKTRNMKNDFSSKLLMNLTKKLRMKFLATRFNLWRKVHIVGLRDVLDRFKQMCYFTKILVQSQLKVHKKAFLKKLPLCIGKLAYRRALNILANLAINGKMIKIKSAVDRWRSQIKQQEIKDLKYKLLRYAVGQEGFKMQKKQKSSYFNRWLRITHLHLLQGYHNTDLKYLNGLNVLANLRRRRLNDLLVRMTRLTNLDPRGKMMLNIRKRLNKPRTSFAAAFERWRRINQRGLKDDMKDNLKSKLITKSCKKLGDRLLRDRKMKCFNKWASHLRKPSDYLLRIIEGEKTFFRFAVKKYLNKPSFVKEIKEYSTKKFLRQCLLKNSKFHLKALDPFFKRWKKTSQILKAKQTNANLVGRLIGRTRKFYANKSVKDLLRKKLNQWSDYIKSLDNKVKTIVPRTHQLIKKCVLKKSFSFLIKPLKAKALKSKKKQKLDECEDITRKWLLMRLRNAVNHWKSQVHKGQMLELRNKTMQAHLKTFSRRLYSKKLNRCFLLWNGKVAGKPNLPAIMIGAKTIKRLMARKPFALFKNKTKLLNIKVPYGMSLTKALTRFNPNVAKCIAIRNIAMRRHFRKWQSTTEGMKLNDIKMDVFKKLCYPNLRNQGRLVLRKSLNRWREVIDKENTIKLQKKFHSTILKNMYAKNNTIWLRHCMNKWREVQDQHQRKLNNISLGVIKLRHKFAKTGLLAFYKKIYVKLDGFSRFAMLKKILINALRNNEKGNLLYSFSRWRKNLSDLKLQMLKFRILKNMLNKYDVKADDSDKNSLHEKLLRWRIRSIPKDYYDNMNRVRLSTYGLAKTFKKRFIRGVYDNIKDRARLQKVKLLMCRLVADYDKKADLYLLQQRVKHWRVRVGDTAIMLEKFQRFAYEFHEESELAYKTLIKKPVNILVDCMKSWVAFKTNKAVTIQDYCKNLMTVFRRMKLVQQHKKVHRLFSDLLFKTDIKRKSAFTLWHRQAEALKTEDKAVIIQKFLRSHRDAYKDKMRQLTRGAEKLDKYAKMKTFNDLFHAGQQMRRRQLLLRLTKDVPEEVKGEFQKKYFRRWHGVLIREREEAASNFIVTRLRGHIARRLKEKLIRKRDKIKLLVLRVLGKYFDKRTLYFHKWLINYRASKCDNAARVIHKFLRTKLNNSKRTNAEVTIKKLLVKSFTKRLAKALLHARKVNTDREQIMTDVLSDIYIRKPFNKLREGCKWIGRLTKLHHAFPIVIQAMRKHYVPFYMRRWKERTYDDKVRKIIQMQNWFRARMLLWKARAQARKLTLVSKYIGKLTNDEDLILKLALKNWAKRALMSGLHSKASAVQAMWRGNTSRKNVDRVMAIRKFNDFFRKTTVRRLCDNMTKCSDFVEPLRRNLSKMNSTIEKRYTTNNLLDLANNFIRNSVFFALTKKREYIGNKTVLREYFNRFKQFSDNSEMAAKKMQTRYRQFKAKKELSRLLKIKELMLKLYGKYDDSELCKLKIASNKWNNRASFLKLQDSAVVIQNFLKVRNARWKNTKKQMFFDDLAEKIVKRRLLNFVKFNHLNNVLTTQNAREFTLRLRNKTLKDKYLLLFTRRFHHLDEQLKVLYMKKYLNDWNREAKTINNKMNAAALMLITHWKGHLAREFLAKLLKKKGRLNYIMSKLTNNMNIKTQLLLRLWYNKIRAERMQQSAKVLTNYMEQFKSKKLKLKAQRAFMKLRQGFKKVDDTLRKQALRKAFDKIKEKKNENLFGKVFDDLGNKKRNLVRSAFTAIKKQGDDNHIDRSRGADLIRRRFLNFKQRKGIMALLEKVKKMRFLLKMMMFRKLRFVNKGFKIWRRNALNEKFQHSANVIQKFLKDRALRWLNEQKITSLETLYKLFRNNFVNHKFRPGLKDFVNSVKLERMFRLLQLHIFKRFRTNVYKYEKSTILSTILSKLTPQFAKKLLRKNFDRWRDQVDQIKQKEAAERIQRNFRNAKVHKQQKDMSLRMEKIILKLANQNEDVRKYYFTIWKRTSQIMKTKENGAIITRFIRKHYDSNKSNKLWWRLTANLYLKNKIYSGLNFLQRYKHFRSLDTIFSVLKRRVQRDAFDDLKVKGRFKKIGNLTFLMFNNFDKRQEVADLWHHLRLWRGKNGKYIERERGLQRLADIFNTRQGIIGSKAVNDACLMKRMFFIIDRIRAKWAFKGLKWRADNKTKLRNMCDSLRKADADLDSKNVVLFHNKLYRLYIFKILDSLYKRINNYQQKSFKPEFTRKFLNRLSLNLVHGSKTKYDEEKEFKRNCKPTVMKFTECVKSNRRDLVKMMTSSSAPKSLLPTLFVNCLRDFISSRNKLALKKMRENQRNHKFNQLINAYVTKALSKPKKTLYDRFNEKYKYNLQTPQLVTNLYKLLRKYFIVSTCEDLLPVGKMHRLIYLLRVTFMHKDIANKRFSREIVRRWRFLIHMRKLAKQKMEAMYKNMHLNYLNMTREVFGDDETNPGVIKDFERFGNNTGLFSNVDVADYEDDKKKFYKKVNKKYHFEPLDLNANVDPNEESHYDENSLMNNRNSYCGDNPEYYYDEGIGDATQGRYKVDTNRSQLSYKTLNEDSDKRKK